jgi:hypothetical protein
LTASIDAQHGDPALDEVLQQIAVVGADLNDALGGREPKFLDRAIGVAPGVLEPALGRGGKHGYSLTVRAAPVTHGTCTRKQASQTHAERIERLDLVQLLAAATVHPGGDMPRSTRVCVRSAAARATRQWRAPRRR